MKQILNKDGVPFTQISNELLNDSSLSLKAIGLYCHMYSKPDDWNFTTKSMATQMKDGRDSILSAMNELKDAGWLSHTKHADGSGDYMLHVNPKSEKPIKAKPKSENPNQENPTVGKPDRINNKYTLQTKITTKQTADAGLDVAMMVIDYLTQQTNRQFTILNPKGKPTEHVKVILSRLKDGYTIHQFKNVIDIKTSQWLKDDKMKKHLNPTTLFRPSNFSKYLDEYVPDIKKPADKNNPLAGYSF